MLTNLLAAISRMVMLPYRLAARFTAWCGRAHSAPNGNPSSRRLTQSLAVTTTIWAIAYAMVNRMDIPANIADILKFLIIATGAGVVVGKFAEKPNPPTPTGDQ
jgi:hypothetical protein